MGEELYDSVATFKAKAYERLAVEGLGAHVAEHHGVDVVGTTPLDGGVFRVDVADGRRWVARLFSRARPLPAVQGDADVLDLVAAHGFCAERTVSSQAAVSVHEGQGVLVTEWVDGVNGRGKESPAVFRSLGALLGRLHAIEPAGGGHGSSRPAGSWHSLSIEGGGREADVRHLRSLLADARSSTTASSASSFDELDEALEGLDVGDGLPTALTHPDFCSANAMLVPGSDEIVLVDWTGAGTAPRVTGLGLLLSSTGGVPTSVDAVLAGYASSGQALTGPELERLDDAVLGFGFVLACWGIAYFGAPAAQVVSTLAASRDSARAIANRVREAAGA